MRLSVWACGLVLAGCMSGVTAPADGNGEKNGAPVDPAELQAQLQQWGDALEEAHPLSFPGDAESLAWEQRKREATEAFVATGAASVPTLHRLRRSPERDAAVLAVAILADIPGPEAVRELRAIADAAHASMNEAEVDHEVVQLAIEGLGRHGDATDVARLKLFLAGGEPQNTIVMSGSAKRAAERRAVLQSAAAESLALLGAYDGMPALIGNLGGGGWARRDAAIRLQRLTGKRFGFALDAPRPDRQESIAAGKAWWAGAKATFKPVTMPPRQAHDIYVRASE